MGSKLEELERIRADLEKAGWLSSSDAISTADLDRGALDHFMAALLQADNVIAWALGFEDRYGASPHRGHALSATIHRLIAELGRIKAGAESAPLSRRGKRHNSRQVDPAFVNLKIAVGVFDRHFSKGFPSANAKHLAVVSALANVGVEVDPASVRRWIEWFKKGGAGRAALPRSKAHRSSRAIPERERQRQALTWLWEEQLAQQRGIEQSRAPGRRRPLPSLNERLMKWMLERIAEAGERCPTLKT